MLYDIQERHANLSVKIFLLRWEIYRSMPDNNGVLDPRFIAIGSQEKAELIRAIQRADGNYDFYGTATEEECD